MWSPHGIWFLKQREDLGIRQEKRKKREGNKRSKKKEKEEEET